MEDRRRLPDLPAQLRRLRRRRDRRPGRPRGPPRPPDRPRRGRALAVPGLPVAAGRRRLRHQRLPGHRAGVRHPGRLRPAARGRARARAEAGHGPGRQPHLGRAPVVRRLPFGEGRPEARLVLVAAAALRHGPGRTRRRADQLGLVLLRPGLDAGRGHRRVLPAPVQPQAARPQLGEPRGPPGRVRDDAVVARPGRRRLPDGRHQHDLQGPGAAGRARPRRRAVRGRQRVLHRRPPAARLPAGDARGRVRAGRTC